MLERNTFPSGSVVLAVGTKRGLFLLSSQDRVKWNVETVSFKGRRIFHAILDQRNGHRLFAAENGDFFGSFVHYSDDFGQSWQDPERGIQFPANGTLKLQNIWVLRPGRPSEPDTLYAGVDPASLWISLDRGRTWEPDPTLLNHPTRGEWGPGAGGLCLHTIVPDASNSSRMWIGISAVGCLRTDDGGQHWQFVNKNTRAGFLPDPYPEFGQCIHRFVQHPTQPETLYQQNHCGIYKTDNAGDDWIDIQTNLPSEFGFPIALDVHHPETLFVVVEDPAGRHNITEQFTVYRTENAGEHWEALTNGLPSGPGVSLGVLRHAMCADTHDPCGIYVGTNTGQIFYSRDRGDHWELLIDFLPAIYSVEAAVIA